jgi:hypothetical protein
VNARDSRGNTGGERPPIPPSAAWNEGKVGEFKQRETIKIGNGAGAAELMRVIGSCSCPPEAEDAVLSPEPE